MRDLIHYLAEVEAHALVAARILDGRIRRETRSTVLATDSNMLTQWCVVCNGGSSYFCTSGADVQTSGLPMRYIAPVLALSLSLQVCQLRKWML